MEGLGWFITLNILESGKVLACFLRFLCLPPQPQAGFASWQPVLGSYPYKPVCEFFWPRAVSFLRGVCAKTCLNWLYTEELSPPSLESLRIL